MYAKILSKIIQSLTLTFAFALTSALNAQVNWMTIDQALAAQKAQPKKILIDFYADWCKPCREMDSKTYGNPVISKMINEDFYPVKFDAEGTGAVTIFGREFINEKKGSHSLHDFTKFMNVDAVPALVFVDEEVMPITILHGNVSAKELEPYLTLMATNAYRNIKTKQQWDDYQRKFRSRLVK